MRIDWRLIAAVAVGGALGSVVRYLVGAFIQGRVATPFPVGTFAVNISGSLLLGFLMRLGLETTALGPEMRFFLTTGFCGGYTTFSTFSYETFRLFEDGEYGTAGFYVASSVVLALLGCAIGMSVAGRVISIGRAGLSGGIDT
ncbi:MAG TPA: fluoride efflux transporter CrcB [Gemmatimonadaceae bacterium]|jgi:CrcB protein|nr:fluoride efflux transporter CrcB [Gemmatimonadaceae bacterium]